jgi:DNA-binding NarL/FixJ family response regulator
MSQVGRSPLYMEMARFRVALHNVSIDLSRGLVAQCIGVTGATFEAVVVGIASEQESEDLPALMRSHEGLPVLVLVPRAPSRDDALRALTAIELGVSAILPSDLTAVEIGQALEELIQRGSFPDPFTSELLIKGVRARVDARSALSITARERDVLALLVDGHTTADIAKALGMSIGTAQTHLKSLYRKLDVCSKAAATAVALRQHLI